jgi:hypothetical protein
LAKQRNATNDDCPLGAGLDEEMLSRAFAYKNNSHEFVL